MFSEWAALTSPGIFPSHLLVALEQMKDTPHPHLLARGFGGHTQTLLCREGCWGRYGNGERQRPTESSFQRRFLLRG